VEREALELEKKDLDDFVLGEGGRGMAAIGDCGGWGSCPSAKLWLKGECGPGVWGVRGLLRGETLASP
jgi:hypothetical protein